MVPGRNLTHRTLDDRSLHLYFRRTLRRRCCKPQTGTTRHETRSIPLPRSGWPADSDHMRLAALFALLALLAPQTVPFKATLEGTVRDNVTNEPMVGVSIYLLKPSEFQPTPTSTHINTDRQGRFSFTVNSSGRYRVIPQQSGFVYARPARVES